MKKYLIVAFLSMSQSFNLAHAGGGVFVSDKNINAIIKNKQISFLQGLNLFGIIMFSPNQSYLKVLHSYKISDERINQILDSVFEEPSKTLFFIAVHASQTKDEEDSVFSYTPILYSKNIDNSINQKEFQKWLKKQDYDFLAFPREIISNHTEKSAMFLVDERDILDSFSGKVTIQVKCECEEPDIFFNDFSGYTKGVGGTFRDAVRNAKRNCGHTAQDFFTGAEANFVRKCSYLIK